MNYTCPYCNQPTTITSPNEGSEWRVVDISATHLPYPQKLGLYYQMVACPNTQCKQISLKVQLTDSSYQYGRYERGATIQFWQLLPDSIAKPQPTYIPSQIVTDYVEACRIKDLSPKASATLSRRCLQGMIRDFWGIHKRTLAEEIAALEGKVNSETWLAIDAVRTVGNIGAHMEKNVDIIVDIEPGEAEMLIELIEDMFDEWYVARHNRERRMARIQNMAREKTGLKSK